MSDIAAVCVSLRYFGRTKYDPITRKPQVAGPELRLALLKSQSPPARQCRLGIPSLPDAKAENGELHCKLRAAARVRHSQLPAVKAENLASCTANSATQCRLNPVSGRNLPKTGVFQLSAGDYRLFRSENAQNRGPETGGQFAKARHWQAFLLISGTFSPGAGLPGWRRSGDRTSLQANSLLTGNFTGNSAISGLPRPIFVARNRCAAVAFRAIPYAN